MADYPRYEYQGRAECPKCRRAYQYQYRIQDARGYCIGSRVERVGCGCVPEDEGRILEVRETLDEVRS